MGSKLPPSPPLSRPGWLGRGVRRKRVGVGVVGAGGGWCVVLWWCEVSASERRGPLHTTTTTTNTTLQPSIPPHPFPPIHQSSPPANDGRGLALRPMFRPAVWAAAPHAVRPATWHCAPCTDLAWLHPRHLSPAIGRLFPVTGPRVGGCETCAPSPLVPCPPSLPARRPLTSQPSTPTTTTTTIHRAQGFPRIVNGYASNACLGWTVLPSSSAPSEAGAATARGTRAPFQSPTRMGNRRPLVYK